MTQDNAEVHNGDIFYLKKKSHVPLAASDGSLGDTGVFQVENEEGIAVLTAK